MIGWSARRKQPFDWPAISAARGLADYFAIGQCFRRSQQCHEIIQNRLALVREESVSVGHRRQPLPVN